MIDINLFAKEVDYIVKNERYSVRDNGAIFRHPEGGKRKRSLDSKWTFGKENKQSGYMEFAGIRVHRLVAKAFHGEQPSKTHVVNHIDNNRKNNRLENLRWITKLESILLQPVALALVELIYGNIDCLESDTSKLFNDFSDRKLEEIIPASKEEIEIYLKRLRVWAMERYSFISEERVPKTLVSKFDFQQFR